MSASDRQSGAANAARAVVVTLSLLIASPALADPAESFPDFLKSFEARAIKAGVTAATYEKATAGMTPDPRIPALVTGQPEFATPIWDYLDARITDSKVSRGRAAMATQAPLALQSSRPLQNEPSLQSLSARHAAQPDAWQWAAL